MNNTVSIAILAGGLSKRFGKDKLKLKFRGKTFIENIIDKVLPISNDVFIVGRKLPLIKSCEDSFKIKASLVGIYTALDCAKNKHVLIIAGDLPLIKPELLKYLISKISQENNIIVPVVRGFYEPLLAIYSKSIKEELFKMIKKYELKVSNIYNKFKIVEIGEHELKKYDKNLISFFNINNQKDYNYLKENFE